MANKNGRRIDAKQRTTRWRCKQKSHSHMNGTAQQHQSECIRWMECTNQFLISWMRDRSIRDTHPLAVPIQRNPLYNRCRARHRWDKKKWKKKKNDRKWFRASIKWRNAYCAGHATHSCDRLKSTDQSPPIISLSFTPHIASLVRSRTRTPHTYLAIVSTMRRRKKKVKRNNVKTNALANYFTLWLLFHIVWQCNSRFNNI